MSRWWQTPALGATVAVTTAAGAWLSYRLVYELGMDIPDHVEYAKRLAAGEPLVTPHFLFELLVIGVRPMVPGGDWQVAATLLLTLLSTALSLVVAWWVTERGRRAFRAGDSMAVLMSWLVHPIVALAPVDGHLYHGYLTPNAHHSSTMLLLKVFAVPTLALYMDAIERRPRVASLVALALLVVAGAFAKPSLIMCLLPASAVFCAWRAVRRQPVPLMATAIGVWAAGFAVLALQYFVLYDAGGGGSGVDLAPFEIMSLRSDHVILKLMLSLALPVAALFAFWRVAPLAWELIGLLLLAGLAISYGLAENGAYRDHGNFVWSGQIALYLVFVYVLTLLGRADIRSRLPEQARVLLWVLLAAHGVAGALWLTAHLTGDPENWW